MVSLLNRKQSTVEPSLVEIEERLKVVESKLNNTIQKVGLIRFNPYNETGGNVSFVVALLDGNNNGVVVTSLHARGGTRVYAKEVRSGKSHLELSKDEQRAILNAIEKL